MAIRLRVKINSFSTVSSSIAVKITCMAIKLHNKVTFLHNWIVILLVVTHQCFECGFK